MAHPQMFDDDDPMLARVRELALGFPEAAEKVSHGRPAFHTKKIFAMYGASLKNGAGVWVQHPQSIVVLADDDERHALLEDERTFVPAYWGPYGWVGLDLGDDTDWGEVAELLEDSFRATALKRAIKALDERSAGSD